MFSHFDRPGRKLTVAVGLGLSGIFCIAIGGLSKLDIRDASKCFDINFYTRCVIVNQVLTWIITGENHISML